MIDKEYSGTPVVDLVNVRTVYSSEVVYFSAAQSSSSPEEFLDNLDSDRAVEEAARIGTKSVNELRKEFGL